jgi:formylglycine-generating enzyme required for sulfatase activity
MKTKPIIFIVLVAVFIITTGATTNDKSSITPPKGYVFIPMGTADIAGKSVTFQAFYIAQTEITNGQYLEFLTDLKTKGKLAEYEKAKIDTTLWIKFDDSKTSNYDKTYTQKKDYPVVNISKEGAVLYCKWLSDKFSNDKVNMEFRLPTNSEWEYAAKGGLKGCPYPWGGPYPTNSTGCYLAQFKVFGLTYGPVEVKHFAPNMWKLYDMSGNVAEMVGDTNIVRGGSWNSSGYEIQIPTCGQYSISPMVGFRPIMTFIEKKN